MKVGFLNATGDSATPAPSGGMAFDPVSGGIQAATAIASTIANISDMAKRRRFEQAISLLSLQQQKELNDKLAKANTQTDRLAILSANIVQYAIANDNRTANKDIALYIVSGSLAVVLLTAAIFYSIKKK